MNRLITARDVARCRGLTDVRGLILMLMEKSIDAGLFQARWDGEHVGGAPITAYVDFGRWLARCECGQCNYVDPDEAVMYCARCGNRNSGLARPVLFPSDRTKIEEALLRRAVTENPAAMNIVQAALLAKPKNPVLTRNWYPGQSLESLVDLNSMNGVD